MNRLLRLATMAYAGILIGCTIVFFVQRSIVYEEHIRPGKRDADSPIMVRVTDPATGQVTEAELMVVNDGLAKNPLRMGNEIEEHLAVLLVANLATGVLLLLVSISLSTKAGTIDARELRSDARYAETI